MNARDNGTTEGVGEGAQTSLQQMETDGQHQAGSDEQDQQGRPPDKTINGIQRF